MVKNEILSYLSNNDLIKNLVGVVTDRGPNMFSSQQKGIANRFQTEYEDLVLASDFCHSFNLAIGAALRKLPGTLLSFIREVCTHFSRSAIRRAKFKQVQINLKEKDITDIRPILSYIPKKWSSLVEASERIRLVWFALEAYFDGVKYEEKTIPDMSQDNHLYLELLCALLKRINAHLLFFQRDDHDYSGIMPKIREIFCLTSEIVIKANEEETQDPISRFDF